MLPYCVNLTPDLQAPKSLLYLAKQPSLGRKNLPCKPRVSNTYEPCIDVSFQSTYKDNISFVLIHLQTFSHKAFALIHLQITPRVGGTPSDWIPLPPYSPLLQSKVNRILRRHHGNS